MKTLKITSKLGNRQDIDDVVKVLCVANKTTLEAIQAKMKFGQINQKVLIDIAKEFKCTIEFKFMAKTTDVAFTFKVEDDFNVENALGSKEDSKKEEAGEPEEVVDDKQKSPAEKQGNTSEVDDEDPF